MTVTIFDEIAQWVFDFNHDGVETSSLSAEDKKSRVLHFLSTAKKSLEILNQDKLLVVRTIHCYNYDKEDALYKVFSINDTNFTAVESILDTHLDKWTGNGFIPPIILQGSTLIFSDNENKFLDGIIKVMIDFSVQDLHITTYSDCWIPIDRNDQLQLEMAELNAPRLQQALSEIYQAGFHSVFPAPDEPYWDHLLPQKGFSVMMRPVMLNEVDLSNLDSSQRAAIDKYLFHTNTSL